MESTTINSHVIRSHIKQQQQTTKNDKQFHKSSNQKNTEFDRKLTELLEWQKEQEEQVKLAEQFTAKLKRELEKADIEEFQYRSVDEIITTDRKCSNDEPESGEFNDLDKNVSLNQSNNNADFNERLLSDIVEESFEQGLSNDVEHQSKFSTPKETIYHHPNEVDNAETEEEDDEEISTYNSLNKQYTKHCTEECTKQNCSHAIRSSESYEQILKIISSYNAKLKNGGSVHDLDEEAEDNESNTECEDDEDLEDDDHDTEAIKENHVDFKDELKQRYSSSNQNIYELNEFFKEELTKSLNPLLNNDQYVYRSLSETNLNYSQDGASDSRSMGKDEFKGQKDYTNRLRNRTFSSDAINNQLRSIEKDLGVENIENVPIKPGIDGERVKTFDELLNKQLNDYEKFSSLFIRSDNSTKRPFLRKGAGLRRFQSRSTSEPRGKLCRIRNQKMKQMKQPNDEKKKYKKHIDKNRKLPDPKRIDYLAQPKFTINRDFGSDLDKENEMYKSNQKLETINRDYMTSNLSDKFKDDLGDKQIRVKSKIMKSTNIPIKKTVSDRELMKDNKISQKEITANESEQQAKKKAKVQLISKISLKKSYQEEKRIIDDRIVEKEWNKQETIEDSNKRLESLLEKFIELYEAKNNTKADEETRQHLIGMLRNSLRMEESSIEPPITCRDCGKNLEESDDSESGSFCCNSIEADRTSSKFANDLNTLLVTPKIGMQTVALRNKIENLQRRLTNLQARCDRDEQKIDKSSNCQSFKTKIDSKECTCSSQMEQLKEKLNFITNKLQAIEKDRLLHGSTAIEPLSGQNKRVINHRIVIDEPEDDEKMQKFKKQNMHKSRSSLNEPQRKQCSNIQSTEVDQRLIDKQKSANITIERTMDGDNRITKYRNGLKVTEKSDGTVEKICSNGYREVFFADDTIMRVLVDGTKIIDYSNGEREIRTSNYKRREFVDGSIRTQYNDGTKETRYLDGKLRVKDRYGNTIIDSRLPVGTQH